MASKIPPIPQIAYLDGLLELVLDPQKFAERLKLLKQAQDALDERVAAINLDVSLTEREDAVKAMETALVRERAEVSGLRARSEEECQKLRQSVKQEAAEFARRRKAVMENAVAAEYKAKCALADAEKSLTACNQDRYEAGKLREAAQADRDQAAALRKEFEQKIESLRALAR